MSNNQWGQKILEQDISGINKRHFDKIMRGYFDNMITSHIDSYTPFPSNASNPNDLIQEWRSLLLSDLDEHQVMVEDEPTDPNEGKTDDELYLERCGM